MNASSFGGLNSTVLFIYLVGMLAIGFLFSSRTKNKDDFLLGGRKLPWLAVGMSMYASVTSAVTFMGLPAIAYSDNISLIGVSLASILVAPIILKFFYPLYHAQRVTTSYEYIKKRYGVFSERIVSALFVLGRLGWLGTVIYAPALVLSHITGFDLSVSIVTMGIIATLYTFLGGLAAVIWTDVIQFILLIVGMVWVAFSLTGTVEGGATAIVEHGIHSGRFDVFEWPPSLFHLSLPLVGLSFFLQLMQEYGTDQVTVQRMMATGSQQKTLKAILFNAIVDLFTISTLLYIGLGLWALYPTLPNDIQPDGLLPYYILEHLPNGVSGLVITAIFAAAMSSVDSGINALTSVCVTNFKPVKNPLKTARLLTLILGISATILAFYVSTIGGLIEAFTSFMSLFSAPVLALFLLGICSKRASLGGWLIGTTGSIGLSLWLQHGLETHWVYYFPASFLTVFTLGYVASLIIFRLSHLHRLRKNRPISS
jgi:SSS family transporter